MVGLFVCSLLDTPANTCYQELMDARDFLLRVIPPVEASD